MGRNAPEPKLLTTKKLLRAGFEPATYGFLTWNNYSPPLYQLSYRRLTDDTPHMPHQNGGNLFHNRFSNTHRKSDITVINLGT